MDSDFGVFHDRVVEIASLQGITLNFFDGNSVRRTWKAIIECEFSKILAHAQDCQGNFLSIRADQANFNFALFDQIEYLSRIIAVENDLSGSKGAPFGYY